MSRAAIRFWLYAASAIVIAAAPACALVRRFGNPRLRSSPMPTATEFNAYSAGVIPTLQPSPTSIPSQVAAATPQLVTVTAAKGNLFVRRGPDLAFNQISVLRQGQKASASARDVLAKWLMIELPGMQGVKGWISIMSVYTVVEGDVASLPEIAPTEWPSLAFLRNCTHDQMVAEPGGIQIPPVDAFPANDVQINPGTYMVHDSDVDGYPEVLTVDIREGSAVDIRVDGNGDKRKCPVP